jgi:hypothetical protein
MKTPPSPPSNPGRSSPGSIRDEDMSLSIAWIDGELAEPERTRFELRLAAEPELRRAVTDLVGADELVRRVSRTKQHEGVVIQAGSRFRAARWALAAAAAVVAIVALRALFAPGSERADLMVAMVPSYESPSEWIAGHAGLAGLRPPGLDQLRGSGEAPNVGADEFARKAHAVEAELFARIGVQSEAPRAGFFVIPYRSRRDASVLVLGFPEKGASVRYFPEVADSKSASAAARVAAGDHVLPTERVGLSGTGASVEYHRGFLVPIGAVGMDVVIAAREKAVGADEIAVIDAGLVRDDKAHVIETLRASGFDVRELRVLEPRD